MARVRSLVVRTTHDSRHQLVEIRVRERYMRSSERGHNLDPALEESDPLEVDDGRESEEPSLAKSRDLGIIGGRVAPAGTATRRIRGTPSGICARLVPVPTDPGVRFDSARLRRCITPGQQPAEASRACSNRIDLLARLLELDLD
jgi:hypothetical protein